MKTTIAWLAIIILLLGSVWYVKSTSPTASSNSPAQSDSTPSPVGAAGINGSANQGNMGTPDTGVVQQPLADGQEDSVIGANVALGIDRNPTLGSYLIAYNGMTLYTFSKDTSSESTCYDTCAANWPPYVVAPQDTITNIKAGVDVGKVGSTLRNDGNRQVTYDGHPLYFFAKDITSGDTKGEKVNNVWFVVKP